MNSINRSRPDFPFYAGDPVSISPQGWSVLMLSIVVAFATLLFMPPTSFPASLLPALVFAGVPLATLSVLTGRDWRALFQRIGLYELGLMVVTTIGTMAASATAVLLLAKFSSPVSNPVVTAMTSMSVKEYIHRVIPTAPQLLGEELLTIFPFLAILWLMTQRLGIGRNISILVALIVSSALFGAAHLSTYDWHVIQCFGVIGTGRAVLTLSYIRTRNLWVPFGAHLLNDWAEFTFVFSFGHVPIAAGSAA